MESRIVILGRGNVACSLDEALRGAGHEVVQLWHRGEKLQKGADFYIVAVADAAIPEVMAMLSEELASESKLHVVVHTSGATPLMGSGVLYPMQTFTKGRRVDWKRVPVFVEGKDEEKLRQIRALGESISDSVRVMDSEHRRILHMAAVWACNFPNHLWNVCQEVLEGADVPFDVMLPLIDETVAKIHEMSPQEAQTGPARRKDYGTMERHKALLEGEHKQLYAMLSESIMNEVK